MIENQKVRSVNVNSLCHFFLLFSETISMQKEAGPMLTLKTPLQSTWSNAVFKGTENGEKKKIEDFLMAEIMISGRI